MGNSLSNTQTLNLSKTKERVDQFVQVCTDKPDIAHQERFSTNNVDEFLLLDYFKDKTEKLQKHGYFKLNMPIFDVTLSYLPKGA